MTTICDVVNQVYCFTGKKSRDEDLRKFTAFLDKNKIDYKVAYNAYSIRDGIQVNVIGSLNDLAILEYCVNNDMIF